MRPTLFPVLALALACVAVQAQSKSISTAANRDDCKVVEMKKGESSGGGMSSSVTAGGGRVSGQTTMPDGSVTTHSGSSAGSSVGSGTSSSASSSAASSADGTTIVTNSDGSCTIFVDPDKQKEKSR